MALIEATLAACVNILPGMRSIYRWEGVVERAQETVMIVKTNTTRSDAVVAAVRARHPYKTPAIVVVPVTGGEPAYLAWIITETAE
ncbi:divalent-cation tolerance protein CutA [Blastochloris viridis]|uniref:Periplasmic divalent cation tolerance protein cutA n=1 Tax=Blastochloris viridis TaxID=1079 RepID=A0A182D6L8_BLAVI|nr:divalent-cation tolerance protein CutA [Blastochloris viridis]BAS01085.1 periplasmic divalent cation tolerance protein cutA [Blastochloris viridis]